MLNGNELVIQSGSIDDAYQLAEAYGVANKEVVDFVYSGKGGLKEYEASVQAATQSTANLKNIGGTLLSTFTNMAVMYAASAAIEFAITSLDNYIHRLDIAIEKGEEAKSAIDESFNTYSDKQSTITDMGKQFAKSEDDIKSTGDAIESVAKKYDELSKGVNNLTNENMSLTDDEYQTYLQTCNQLAEIFPSLVTGYDEQGNALISLGNGAQSANDQLTALLNTQRQIANMDMGKNLQDIYEGVLAQDEKYRNEIALYQSKRGNVENKQTEASTFLEQVKAGIISNSFTGSRDFITKLQTALSEQGIYAFDIKDIDLASNKNAEAKGFTQMLTLRPTMSEEQLNEVYDYLEAYFANENDSFDAETAKFKELENTTELKRKDNQKSISDYISKYITTKDSVSNFDVSLQNALSNSLASMINFDVIDTSFGGDIEQYLYSKFIVPLSEISKDGQKEIAKLFDLDKNEISLKDYNKQVNDVFEQLFPDDKQLQSSMKKSFGFQDVISDAYKQTQVLYSKFGDNIKEIDKMSVGDREIAYNLVINDGFTGTFDELQKKIHETANLDDISSSVTAFQDAYNALQTAIEEQNSTGYISNDTIKSLTENNTLYAECLYKTASGMQLDTQKANDLSKAQSELNLAALEANKTLKQAEYDKNVAEMERLAGGAEELKKILAGTLTGDYDDIFSLSSANEEIQTQIDSWSELENSIRGTMSALQQYKDAQSSANASDNYQTIVSGKKDADKLYKQGWTTKDDFTSYALLLAKNGSSIEEAVSNYESNAKRFSKYLTEDTSGLYNFLDDAVNKSKELGNTFVTVGDDGKYAFNITSMNDFADSMSMNTQMAENFMLALKDMGFNVDLSMIGDSFAESVSGIDTSAEDASQQVQGIIDRMQELSQQGVDVSSSFEAVSSALQSLNGNGVDISGMVSQLNEIMNGSGYQIDPVTLKVVGEADMSQVEEAENSVSNETLEKTVKYNADTSGLSSANTPSPQSATVNVESNNTAAKTGTDEAVNYASGKKAIMKIDADNSPAKSKSNEAKSYADGLTGTISVNANTSGISSSISNALSGSYSINVKANVSGLPSKTASAKVYGTAHANGTALPHISSAKFNDGLLGSAYASGNWGVDKDQDALIGEIAPEILVRNGRFMTVGNYGAEMVHLRKGDIIFNHKQSEAILKNGYATGRGKVIGGNAHVNGTTGNAYYNSTITGGSTNLTKRPGQSLGSGTYKNTKSTDANTKAKDKNTKSTKKSTQAFDWVAKRLQYFSDKTKAIADTITDYVTSAFKQTQLKKQISTIAKEINANIKGANIYQKKADGVKLSNSWKKKVREGNYSIQDIKDEKLTEKIEKYQDYYDKMKDCKQAVVDLRNEQLDLFSDWANMPTEAAEKKIDKLTKKYNILASTYESVSAGSSTSAQFFELYNNSINQDVQSAKKSLNSAKSATAKAKSKLTSKQQKSAGNGNLIPTKGLKGQALKNAKAYNNAVKAQNAAQANYNIASQIANNYSDNFKTSSKYKNDTTYLLSNALLDDELANQKKQNDAYQQAYKQSVKNAYDSKANSVSASNALNKKINSILSNGKLKLTDKQRQNIKSGKEISEKGLSGKTLKQIQEYNKLVANAASASTKYSIALDAQDTAADNAANSQSELAQKIVETEKEKFDNIKNYYESLLDYQKASNSLAEKSIEIAKSHGDYITQMDYNLQIVSAKAEQNLEREKVQKLQEQLNTSVAKGIIKENSIEWLELKTQIAEAESAIKDYDIEIENLKQEKIAAYYEEQFDRAMNKVDQFINKLETINNLIKDEMMFDDDGRLTEMGMLSMALNVNELNKNTENLQTAIKKRQELLNDSSMGAEKHDEMLSQAESEINEYISAISNARDKIIDIVKQQSEAEKDALFDVIDARKTALEKKKDYYEYDKTLKSKTKEINLLKQQIAALDGVTDAESRAKKARLEAQLADAQDDLESTVKDHVYELQVTGLDDLKDQLDKDYEEYVKTLSSNLQEMTDAINNCVNSTAANTTQALATMNNLLKAYGINISAEDFLNISGSFAKGTRHVSRKGIYRTQEKGGEIIVTKDEVFMPLSVGDKVFTNDMTERLYDIASGDNSYTAPTFTLPKIDFPDIPDSGGECVITNHYDSLIHVNGNVDKYVVDDIKKLGKDLMNDRDFKERSYKFITSEIAKDLRK